MVAVWTFYRTQREQLRWEQFKRREDRYRDLLKGARGLHDSEWSSEAVNDLLRAYDECWLYAPDEVIRKGNRFLESVTVGSQSKKADHMTCLAELVHSMRSDLMSRKALSKTRLEAHDYKHLAIQQ
jgi:hypothetical protein